ncbi:leucyl aminopeptidase [Microbacterium sp. ru370.1]|uniref:leucyl aminopeptidase n=1 Tax=unclassified Microbacterium TaxID=2609290 RepID=UPI000891CB38|nr:MULTISPECIES: leucyl aminopeptidase [unclassified Microbacterium]SDO76513.1 leucyl aminopeptidase [Microbacterium sp. ru370.1]SIT88590.1 leucyl aminopeptidase [Microbacterium sp. RU1D]
MPFPSVAYTHAPVLESDADAILLIVPTTAEGATDPIGWEGLGAALAAVGFAGAAGSYQRVHVPGIEKPVAVVGAGSETTEAAVRDAAGTGLRQLTGFHHVAIESLVAAPWRPIAEGAALGGYRFADYKKKSAKARAERVSVSTAETPSEADIAAVAAISGAVALVKDLVTTPAEWLGPADFADAAVAAVKDLPVEVEVLDEAALRDGGYGGILGVGQGSDRPPRMVRLEYAPAGAERHVALVGKGITFDTGGLSLKPPASMVGMKYDMCGAATVLAVLKAAAEMALPVKVSAWLCIADNMPSGRATRPGDVLRTLDGTTVEVLNTDAEGRLVLADGLAAASRENPDLIVDVATLTGAITVALGNRHTGVMGDDAAVASYLEAAGRVAELAWQLPLPDHMVDDLDSPIADLQNAKIGDPAGGSLFAGLFLRHFVGRVSEDADAPRIPWVHLDIAGVGMNKSAPFGYTDKGVTGATVRSLVELLASDGAR